MAEIDLELSLIDLGRHVEFPRTPDVATVVLRRLQEPPRRTPWWRGLTPWPRALAVAFAVVLAVVGAALVASPEARQAVADRLGIGGVSVVHVPEVPTPEPSATPTAVSTREPTRLPAASVEPTPLPAAPLEPTRPPIPSPVPGASLGLGTRVSLDEARQRFGGALLVPDLGPPDAVYVMPNDVSLVYAARPGIPASAQTRGVGLVLTQFRASIDQTLLGQKGLGPNTRLEDVQIAGRRGLWIAGAPHLFLRAPNGDVRDYPARLAGNTLLWEQDGVTFRLESGLDRDAALRIAESVR
jgi:hypothetical protein